MIDSPSEPEENDSLKPATTTGPFRDGQDHGTRMREDQTLIWLSL